MEICKRNEQTPLTVLLEVVGDGRRINYQKLVDPQSEGKWSDENWTVTQAGQPRLMSPPKAQNYSKLIDSYPDALACPRRKPCQDFDCNRKLHCSKPIPMKITCVQKPLCPEGPIGRITRNQDFDIIGSKMVYKCTCGQRNGLDEQCRRISCQNNPGCKMNPPRCWPQYRPKPEKSRCIEGPVQLCYCFDEGTRKN